MLDKMYTFTVRLNQTRIAIIFAVLAVIVITLNASNEVDDCVRRQGVLFRPIGGKASVCLTSYTLAK